MGASCLKHRVVLKKLGIQLLAAAVLAGFAVTAVPATAVEVLADEAEDTGSASSASEAPSTQSESSGGASSSSGQNQNSSTGSGGGEAAASSETSDGAGNSGTDAGSSDIGSSYGASGNSDADGGVSGSGGTDASEGSTENGEAGLSSATDETAEAASTEAAAAATTEELLTEEELGEPDDYGLADAYTGTNAELIARQHIVTDMPVIHRDFRFYQVDADYAFAKAEMKIFEERSDDATVVGTIAANGLLYVLEEEDDGWLYVESGDARGFVKSDQLVTGDDAEQMLAIMESESSKIASLLPEGMEEKNSYVFYAQATVPYYENEAYAYRRITAQDPVIDKVFAIANTDVSILEEDKNDAQVAGTLSEGGLAYVIQEEGEWDYIESGNVRGFVKSSHLDTGSSVDARVSANGESSYATAEEVLEPSENRATYYTLTSVKEGTKYSEVREKILELALSCVGNPYVWGGTSLTNGADCSGFVQALYARFGYSIPRVAADQSTYGTQIPVSDAEPGDLIFFARNGYVYHVAMYAGDGKTVEAYSSRYGIITKALSNRNAVWATRIIQD